MTFKPGKLVKAEDCEFRFEQKSSSRNSNLDLLSYGSYWIEPGIKSDDLCHPDEEAILFSMAGRSKVILDNSEYVLNYYDVLYVPKGQAYHIENISDERGHVIICKAKAEKKHPPFYASWEKFSNDESRIRHLKGKDVFLMFDVSESADRLMAGYTIYEPNTRAWPAHNHVDQEEVYIFTKGKGAMEVYSSEENKTFVTSVNTMDAVTIPLLNYHPVFSQNEELHFIWCIAGKRYWVGDKNKDFMKGDSAELTT